MFLWILITEEGDSKLRQNVKDILVTTHQPTVKIKTLRIQQQLSFSDKSDIQDHNLRSCYCFGIYYWCVHLSVCCSCSILNELTYRSAPYSIICGSKIISGTKKQSESVHYWWFIRCPLIFDLRWFWTTALIVVILTLNPTQLCQISVSGHLRRN